MENILNDHFALCLMGAIAMIIIYISITRAFRHSYSDWANDLFKMIVTSNSADELAIALEMIDEFYKINHSIDERKIKQICDNLVKLVETRYNSLSFQKDKISVI